MSWGGQFSRVSNVLGGGHYLLGGGTLVTGGGWDIHSDTGNVLLSLSLCLQLFSHSVTLALFVSSMPQAILPVVSSAVMWNVLWR